MMELFQQIRNYFEFYRRAQTIYDIHSPLAAKLIEAYIWHQRKLPEFLEKKRIELLQNGAPIQPEDYGAGSKSHAQELTVASVARRSLSTVRQLRGLYQLTEMICPEVVIELGTSFGLSSLTMQFAAPQADIFSIEGNQSIHSKAKDLIGGASLSRIPHLINGTFQKELPDLLEKIDQIDLVFIDGDHTLQGTLSNMNTILPFLHDRSIVLIHDIYWSIEMKLAWQQCQHMEQVRMSLDFYDLGILIFDQNLNQKQHFSIIPYWCKPWRIGLFA